MCRAGSTKLRPAIAVSTRHGRSLRRYSGTGITYAHINGLGTSIGAIVDALRDLPRVVVQAMFVRDGKGQVDNTTGGAVHEWLRKIDSGTQRPSRCMGRLR